MEAFTTLQSSAHNKTLKNRRRELNLIEAIREAILDMIRCSPEIPRVNESLLRQLVHGAIADADNANFPPSLGEANMEHPWIPDDGTYWPEDTWDRFDAAMKRRGYRVFAEAYDASVMTFQPADQHLPDVADDVASRIHTSLRACASRNARHLLQELQLRGIESPIEQMFYSHFVIAQRDATFGSILEYDLVPQFCVARENDDTNAESTEPYRIDFAVHELGADYSFTNTRVAIECDSYTFHERSSGQFAYEKERDRFLHIQGWHLIRFAGSEITRDPLRCAQQVLDYLRTRLRDSSETEFFTAEQKAT